MRSFEKGRTQPGRQPLLPAATLVLLRDDPEGLRVLLLRRHRRLAFHGGAWVFPGGRIEPAEWAAGKPDLLAAARRAAVRETREEAGLSLLPAACVPLSRWTTPRGLRRRFVTWFFAARVAPDALVRIDGREIVESRWLTPAAALDARQAGLLALPPPTFVTLWELSGWGDAQTALAHLAARPLPRFSPRPCTAGDVPILIFRGDAACGGGPLEGPGPRHRLVMCAEGWCYQPPAPPETQPHPTHNL